MLVEVDVLEFKKKCFNSISLDGQYLSITALANNLTPVYYIFYDNAEPMIGFALFKKGKNIVLPKQLVFFSGIWYKECLYGNDFKEYLFSAIAQLKNIYNNIKLVVSPLIEDLRPFLWNDFDVKLRYTFQKNTDDENYKSDIKKNYRKALSVKLNLEITNFQELNWADYISFFKNISFGNTKIKKIKEWLELLDKHCFLLCVNIADGVNQNQGSGIVLLDHTQKAGYFIFSYVPKTPLQSEINAFLYIEIQKELLKKDIKVFDYLGANISSISNYKSRFNPTLKPYYIVIYKKKYFNFQSVKNSLKYYLKRYLIR